MQKLMVGLSIFTFTLSSYGQKIETVYLNPKDSASDMYIAVLPQHLQVKAFMFLLDGFGVSPKDVLIQTDLPLYAASKGILTIIPILKTGSLYFGIDNESQLSLKDMISKVAERFELGAKDFYIGGFSIGGSCAVKYAELAVRDNYKIKPKALFAVDPPLDFERFYYAARRVIRLSGNKPVIQEVPYMIDRIEKEMHGSPETSPGNYYELSPYSYSDTTQRAVKTLVHTPVMLITEPDIQWWLNQRGYDYSFINVTDQAAMINELRRLGNEKAVLVTTSDKGFRKPGNIKHPHSWSIAGSADVVSWLLNQN